MADTIHKHYAHIILPLALDKQYTYEVPEEFLPDVEIGKRVQVQFGAKRMYAGIVLDVFQQVPPEHRTKPILSILDDSPILHKEHLRLWQWIADYYMCSLGEVMIAALPAAMKLSSETKVLMNPTFNFDYSTLNDDEYLVAEALETQGEIMMNDIAKIVQKKNTYYLIKSLLDKGVIVLEEELTDSYKPKMVPYISLEPTYKSPDKQQTLFAELEKAPKQLAILLAYLSICGNRTSVSQKNLLKKSQCQFCSVECIDKKRSI